MPIFPAGPARVTPASPTEALAGPAASAWRQLAGAAAALLVAAEFTMAPVTLGCTIAMYAFSRLTKWPPSWLGLPAAFGVGWTVLGGPGRAACGFTASCLHVAAYLAAPGAIPAHLARLPAAITQWQASLAGQFPLALLAAAVQAAVAGRVRERLGPGARRGRGNATGYPRAGAYSGAVQLDLPGPRDLRDMPGLREQRDLRDLPGLALGLRRTDLLSDAASGVRAVVGGPGRRGFVPAARRAYVTAALRQGEVATVDGACLGVDRDTGRRAALSWAETAGGVLVTGRDPVAVTRTGLDVLLAAIQHRKAVIVVDLGARPGPVAAAVMAACSGRRTPLRTVSLGGDPAAGGRTGQARGARTDLSRGATATRAAGVGPDPGRHARAAGDRAGETPAHESRADRVPTAGKRSRRARVLAAAASREAGNDGPARADASAGAGQYMFAEVLASRQVLLLQPEGRAPEGRAPEGRAPEGRAPAAAAGLARAVAAGLHEALAERSALGVPADGLAWFFNCEQAGTQALSELLACPGNAGVSFVFCTASGLAAARLAGEVGAIVVRGQPPGDWPGYPPDGDERLETAGSAGPPAVPAALPAALLSGRQDNDLALLARAPASRVQAGCRAVR